MSNNRLPLLVKVVTNETPDIRLYDLRSLDGDLLPAFSAGAHIDLHLTNGLSRSYSIVNAENERSRYLIAVARDRNSRGGSRHIHETLKPGDLVEASPPRNNFALNEDEHDNVLIAGGIGVTPMMSMIHRLQSLGRKWQLYFATRSKSATPFRVDLGLYPDAVQFHIDDEREGRVLDIHDIITNARVGTHFYCCGPSAMLEAFQRAVAGTAPERVHVEHFSPLENAATGGGFYIELARSKRTVYVNAGKTILAALLESGLEVPSSCQAGVCGACETKVIAGLPDHRDLVLTDRDRNSNKSMMICCSGSKSPKLVLDL